MVTLKERTELLSIRVFPCTHCKGVLGNTTDTVLYMGTGKFERSVTFTCALCDKTVYWRPSIETDKEVSKISTLKT